MYNNNKRPPQNPSGPKPQGDRKPGFRNFFDSGKTIKTNLRPGDSFIFEDSFRPKRSFPFLTPNQALKKFLHIPEEKAKPLAKGTLRVIPFG